MDKTIKLTSIRLNENNPRLIRDGKFKKLVESIKRDPEFLEKRGIVHADGVILGGNQRYLAIKEALKDDAFRGSLPKGEIPASWVQDASDWPEEKRRRFVILDNSSFGETDFDVLANLFSDLPLVDLGVDIPMHYIKPTELTSKGLINKNFNDGRGEDKEMENSVITGNKYPVTFIIEQSEFDLWEAVKGKLKLKDDKSAFLKMIGGKNA